MLTCGNFYAHIFPSLAELTACCIARNSTSYTTLPQDCIGYIEDAKKYPVILFVKKLGSLTFPEPIPIAGSLGYEELTNRVFHQGADVILRFQE